MIGIHKTMSLVIKVTKLNKSKRTFHGTVIESNTPLYKIGYYGTTWDIEQFEMHEETSETYLKDSIVESVINQFKQRSEVGIRKYKTTLDRNDLKPLEWLQHFQEELMDGILYLERLKKEI